jgi:hypothetical protein
MALLGPIVAPSGRRRAALHRRAIACALSALAFLAPGVGAIADTPESVVEAAYLYKFTPFIDWPASAFPSPASPFRLCVLGDDPFGPALDQAVGGHTVADHPIEVRRIKTAGAAAGCHVLYFGGPRTAATADAFTKVRGSPVLTVTRETDGVTGEVIQFVVRDGHVRFAIDPAAATTNGVKISSKLLGLAVPFRSGP